MEDVKETNIKIRTLNGMIEQRDKRSNRFRKFVKFLVTLSFLLFIGAVINNCYIDSIGHDQCKGGRLESMHKSADGHRWAVCSNDLLEKAWTVTVR